VAVNPKQTPERTSVRFDHVPTAGRVGAGVEMGPAPWLGAAEFAGVRIGIALADPVGAPPVGRGDGETSAEVQAATITAIVIAVIVVRWSRVIVRPRSE
jgi:hypothetical protein